MPKTKNIIVKIIAIAVTLILVSNMLTPLVYATIDSKQMQYENDFNYEQSNETIVEDEPILENEDISENSETLENANINNNESPISEEEILEDTITLNQSQIVSMQSIEEIDSSEFSISVNINGYVIHQYITDNTYYLFIPQGIDITNLAIDYTGSVTEISNGTIDEENKKITNNFATNDTINIVANNKTYVVKVLQSDLPSMSISLKDVTLNQINSGSKDTKYKGNSLTLTSSDYNLEDTDVEIKGRGNFTWALPKKCYQLKLSSKQNIFGMGKSKTWILIANYADNSLMRNKLIYDLADEIGLEYSIKSKWVDVWIDGVYEGNFLLTEKVQVGDNRVELQTNDGLIAELDNNYYASETTYFSTKRTGTHFVLKDSIADDEDTYNSVAKKAFSSFENYVNEFESILYSDNINWNKLSSMIDVASFVKYYFIQELSEDPDGCRSSFFIYKDGENDIMHIGPVWDYDSSLGSYVPTNLGGNTQIDYTKNIQKYMTYSNDWYTQLLKIPEFRKLLNQTYENTIKQAFSTINSKINTYESSLQQSSKMNFIRWQNLGKQSAFGVDGHKTKDTYHEEVQYLSNWVSNRVQYMNQRYSTTSDIVKVNYISHVEDIGWQDGYCVDGEISGTEGQFKRVEAIKISLDTFNTELAEKLNIKYQVHVEDYGWMDWKQNGEIAGTTGECKRIEAIRIKLENCENYSIQYRVHVQDIGWMDWESNGNIAGTTGQCKRIEAIQISLIEMPKNTISYTTHVQDIGWQPNVINGQMAGTTGQALRLEGIRIHLENKTSDNIRVKYSTHVEDIGWQDWKYDGDLSGTIGQSLRLEAIKIELEGAENYNIKYRVHVENIGWQDWKQNGEIAGTTGQALRLEAIEIKVEKSI